MQDVSELMLICANVLVNTTGSHSVYTKFNEFEIMYHVAPLLPYQDFDEQRVERKRHLGNDVSHSFKMTI